jgi:hypothetical protein
MSAPPVAGPHSVVTCIARRWRHTRAAATCPVKRRTRRPPVDIRELDVARDREAPPTASMPIARRFTISQGARNGARSRRAALLAILKSSGLPERRMPASSRTAGRAAGRPRRRWDPMRDAKRLRASSSESRNVGPSAVGKRPRPHQAGRYRARGLGAAKHGASNTWPEGTPGVGTSRSHSTPRPRKENRTTGATAGAVCDVLSRDSEDEGDGPGVIHVDADRNGVHVTDLGSTADASGEADEPGRVENKPSAGGCR